MQLKGKPCEPFIAPLDLYPSPEGAGEEQDTVVQPDLIIVCDPEKCREEGVFGAPDWILEVLSPSTASKAPPTEHLLEPGWTGQWSFRYYRGFFWRGEAPACVQWRKAELEKE